MIRKVIHIVLIIIAFLFYWFGDFDVMDTEGILYACVISIVGLLVHLIVPENDTRLNQNFFKPSIFALLGLVIVNLQIYVDYVLGLANSGNRFIWVDNRIVVQSAFISSIGINAFLLGFSLYKYRTSSLLVKVPAGIPAFRVEYNLFFAAVVLGIYYYTIDKNYLFGGYGRVNIGSTAVYMALLFQILIYAYIIQKVRNLYILGTVKGWYDYMKQMGYGVLVLIIIYLFSILLSGDRGPIIEFSLVYAIGFFFLTKKKLSIKNAVLFLFLASFVFNLLRNVRELSPDISFSDRLEIVFLGDDNNAKGKQSISPSTYELAGSVRTLHYAADYIDRGGEYTYGRFLFQQIVTSVPFISLFMPLIFDDMSDKYRGSANFFTWMEQGNFPSSGVGSSVIADFYIDLGIFGVLFGLILFGYIMRFLDYKLYENGIPGLWVMVFVFSYITVALYISRSELFSNLKMVVWIYLYIQINRLFVNRISWS